MLTGGSLLIACVSTSEVLYSMTKRMGGGHECDFDRLDSSPVCVCVCVYVCVSDRCKWQEQTI